MALNKAQFVPSAIITVARMPADGDMVVMLSVGFRLQ